MTDNDDLQRRTILDTIRYARLGQRPTDEIEQSRLNAGLVRSIREQQEQERKERARRRRLATEADLKNDLPDDQSIVPPIPLAMDDKHVPREMVDLTNDSPRVAAPEVKAVALDEDEEEKSRPASPILLADVGAAATRRMHDIARHMVATNPVYEWVTFASVQVEYDPNILEAKRNARFDFDEEAMNYYNWRSYMRFASATYRARIEELIEELVLIWEYRMDQARGATSRTDMKDQVASNIEAGENSITVIQDQISRLFELDRRPETRFSVGRFKCQHRILSAMRSMYINPLFTDHAKMETLAQYLFRIEPSADLAAIDNITLALMSDNDIVENVVEPIPNDDQ